MEIFDRTSVIQGDDQCRDGHYRVKENLLEMAASEDGAEQKLDPNATISLQAQNPTTLGEVKVGSASEEAAGIPAIWNTMLYGIGDMGVMRAPEAFLKINHVSGFDCQSCAWPSPDKHRKERLAKDGFFYLPNAAKQRIFKTSSGKAKLTVNPIPKHDLQPDELLLTTIRSHDQFNSTIYGLDDRYRGVFQGRRVIFLNPLDIKAMNLRAGQIVDIYSHFDGEVRMAPRFAIVPYAIARRSAAAYYPETNVLVPVRSVAAKSNQPAFKCIRIRLAPSDSREPLHFSEKDIEHNLERVVPRLPNPLG